MKIVSQNKKAMSKRLFEDFEHISSKAWKQKIQVDLKGADYNDTLIWKSVEGIDVKPFYSLEDRNQSASTSCDRCFSNWTIGQIIFVNNEKNANQKALDVINRGAETLFFIIPHKDIKFQTLIQNIDLNTAQLHFQVQFLDVAYSDKLYSFIKKQGLKNNKSHTIHVDTISNLAKSGNWFFNLKEDQKQFEDIYNTTKTISIDVSLYQNSGGYNYSTISLFFSPCK